MGALVGRLSQVGMKIRFDHPASLRLSFAPGDEIHAAAISPEIESLLRSDRVDGQKVAHLVREERSEEVADLDHSDEELATVGVRGRVRGHRSTPVS